MGLFVQLTASFTICAMASHHTSRYKLVTVGSWADVLHTASAAVSTRAHLHEILAEIGMMINTKRIQHTQAGLSWGSFYAFSLSLCFESQHVHTDRKGNTNAGLMQTLARRHYTATV